MTSGPGAPGLARRRATTGALPGRPTSSVARRDHACVASASIPVRVQARARRDELVAVRQGVLLVRVAAPALDGRANRALRRVLAERLGVALSNVTIVRGQRSRDKLVQIDGLDQAALDNALDL